MKSNTINLLVSSAAVAFSLQVKGTEESPKFTPAADCGVCHEAAYEEWQQSFHSQAGTDSIFWQFYRQAVSDLTDQAAGYCLACHAPIAVMQREVSAFAQLESLPKLSPLAQEGVTCDFCHTIAGKKHVAKGVDVGAYRYPGFSDSPQNLKYGRHADAVTSDHPTETSEFLIDSEFCGICHKTVHRVGGRELQNTYEEWRRSPYRKEGVRCQDCHMPRYQGQLAVDGPVRDEVHAHVFQGGHSEMLKNAASLWLEAKTRRRRDRIDLTVSAFVKNTGAGHYMPTGIPGLRELWLEVEGRKPSGEEVFVGRVDYGLQLLDGDGKPALFWNTAKVGKDTRLRPRRARESRWRIDWPDEGDEPIELKATLYYRTIGEDLARKVRMPVPEPIPLAADHFTIFRDGRQERLPD